jgi:hypothetical protein
MTTLGKVPAELLTGKGKACDSITDVASRRTSFS